MNTNKCTGTDMPKCSLEPNSMVKKCVSHNFKHIRKQKGFTQEQMAEQIGINRATYAAYEEKRAAPPLSVVIFIANLTGIDMNILLTEELQEEVHND